MPVFCNLDGCKHRVTLVFQLGLWLLQLSHSCQLLVLKQNLPSASWGENFSDQKSDWCISVQMHWITTLFAMLQDDASLLQCIAQSGDSLADKSEANICSHCISIPGTCRCLFWSSQQFFLYTRDCGSWTWRLLCPNQQSWSNISWSTAGHVSVTIMIRMVFKQIFFNEMPFLR